MQQSGRGPSVGKTVLYCYAKASPNGLDLPKAIYANRFSDYDLSTEHWGHLMRHSKAREQEAKTIEPC